MYHNYKQSLMLFIVLGTLEICGFGEYNIGKFMELMFSDVRLCRFIDKSICVYNFHCLAHVKYLATYFKAIYFEMMIQSYN